MIPGAPHDLTFYKALTDLGGFLGAVIAIIAAGVGYLAIRGQIRESAGEERGRRDIALRAEARETIRAATLVGAALEVFEYDLDRTRNTFDPGSSDRTFLDKTIEPERAAWLRGRLEPLIFEPLLPYVGRLNEASAKEYLLICSISRRVKEDDRSTTHGEFIALITTLRERTRHLKDGLAKEIETARR